MPKRPRIDIPHELSGFGRMVFNLDDPEALACIVAVFLRGRTFAETARMLHRPVRWVKAECQFWFEMVSIEIRGRRTPRAILKNREGVEGRELAELWERMATTDWDLLE